MKTLRGLSERNASLPLCPRLNRLSEVGRFSEASPSEVVRLEGINLHKTFIFGKLKWSNC